MMRAEEWFRRQVAEQVADECSCDDCRSRHTRTLAVADVLEAARHAEAVLRGKCDPRAEVSAAQELGAKFAALDKMLEGETK